MRAPKELTQIHPLGKSPVITDGDLVVAESGEASASLSYAACNLVAYERFQDMVSLDTWSDRVRTCVSGMW